MLPKKHRDDSTKAVEPAKVADFAIVSGASVLLNTLCSTGKIINKIYAAAAVIIPCMILQRKNDPFLIVSSPIPAYICKCTDIPPKPMKKAMRYSGYLPHILSHPVVISTAADAISVIIVFGDTAAMTSISAAQITTIPHI